MGRGVFRSLGSFITFWATGFYIMPSYNWVWGFSRFHVLHIVCAICVAHASYCFVVYLPSNPASLKRFIVFTSDWHCLTMTLTLTLTICVLGHILALELNLFLILIVITSSSIFDQHDRSPYLSLSVGPSKHRIRILMLKITFN
jgi:hypothetical protein